jgi:hypothetical protein
VREQVEQLLCRTMHCERAEVYLASPECHTYSPNQLATCTLERPTRPELPVVLPGQNLQGAILWFSEFRVSVFMSFLQ